MKIAILGNYQISFNNFSPSQVIRVIFSSKEKIDELFLEL